MSSKESIEKDIDSLNNKPKSGRGGPRPGSGRKPGKMEEATIEKMRVLEEVKKRIQANAQRLLDAHLTVALGASFLFCKRQEGTGKNRKTIIEQVEDPETIMAYLNGELNQQGDEEWYFITTQKPDTNAINALFDRAFGKPIQTVEGNMNVNYNTVIENLDDEYNTSELEQA